MIFRSILLVMACVWCGPAIAQDTARRSTVPQLSSPGPDTGPIDASQSSVDTAEVRQLTPAAPPRAVPTETRPAAGFRRPPTIAPENVSRGVRVSAPPPGAIDRCEVSAADSTPPPEGLNCAEVLEAAAFVRPSPEERLLTAEEIAPPANGALVSDGRVIPNAALVAQRLETGDLSNSPVALAIAAGFGVRPADSAPAEPPPASGGLPIVIPPDGGQ